MDSPSSSRLRAGGAPPVRLLRERQGRRSRARTALFDGAVVELGLGVGGVAPGAVPVPIRVAAVVLRQVAVRVGARVDPGTTTSPELWQGKAALSTKNSSYTRRSQSASHRHTIK